MAVGQPRPVATVPLDRQPKTITVAGYAVFEGEGDDKVQVSRSYMVKSIPDRIATKARKKGKDVHVEHVA